MFQPAPSNPYREPIITVKGEKLQAVENFTYLGITLSHNIISKVSSAFGGSGRHFGREEEFTLPPNSKFTKQ